MNVFVHVKGSPHAAAEVAKAWGSDAEVVGSPGDGLYLVASEVFAAKSAPDASLLALQDALSRAAAKAFGAAEFAVVGPAEVQLLLKDTVVNASLRKQGVVVHGRSGIVAAAKLTGLDEAALIRATTEAASTFHAASALQQKS